MSNSNVLGRLAGHASIPSTERFVPYGRRARTGYGRMFGEKVTDRVKIQASNEPCKSLRLKQGSKQSCNTFIVLESAAQQVSEDLRSVDSEAGFRALRENQNGTIIAAANRALLPYDRVLGPDPASGGVATVGGVVAKNASG